MAPASTAIGVAGQECRRTALAQRACLWLVAALGAFSVWRAYRGVVFEDAYILFRYARNLSEGLGFVFQPGERVLATMPLTALLLGLGSFLGADVPELAGVVFAASIGAVAVLGGSLLRDLGAPNAALLFAAACVCGFTQSFRYWGYETPLLTALILAALLAAVRRRDVLAGALAALAFLARYDAALFALLLFLALAVRRRRIPWAPGLVALAIATPWLLFARTYFGQWTPNTLTAKRGDVGLWQYLHDSATMQAVDAWKPLQDLGAGRLDSTAFLWIANLALLAGVALALVHLRRRDPPFLLLCLYPVALWLAYAWIGPPVVFTWYIVPALFLLLAAGLAGWSLSLRTSRWPRARFVAALLAVAPALALQPRALARAAAEETSTELYRTRVGAYTELGDFVLERDLAGLTLLTMEPGFFTYRTRNPVIDGAGLVTPGVYFFGKGRKRTRFNDLIQTRRPPLIVAQSPFSMHGYVLLQSALPSMQLFLRAEHHRVRFAALAATPGGVPEGVLRHPFELDAGEATREQWNARGGFLRQVANHFELTCEGVPVRDDYLFLNYAHSGAETPPFLVDFDRLCFRFAATRPKRRELEEAVAQLVVDGRVVLQDGGKQPREVLDFPEVSWPVHAWRGRVARLRFVDISWNRGWLAADHIRSVVDEAPVVLDDFEGADGFGPRWTSATLVAPTDMLPAAIELGHEFRPTPHAATTYGLEGEHLLESRPFAIERDRMSFVWFDFALPKAGVQLFVDGELVREQRGQGTCKLRPVTWDLRDLRGREAVLKLIDGMPNARAWIGIDELVLADDPRLEANGAGR